MSLATEASKLFQNKYFLYVMVFVSAANVLGYLVTNKTHAVIFFALVSLVTYHFSKNMSVVLLVAIVATNFLMSNKRMREGLENQGTNATSAPALNNIEAKDKEIASTIPAVKDATSNDQVADKLKEQQGTKALSGPSKVVDSNNVDLNAKTEEPESSVPSGVGQSMGGKKGGGAKVSENFGPRLDYAATIEQSYQNLDEILGSDSIQKLTKDTQQLMAQQQNLFNTMQNMVPVLEGAQNMLKGFDISSITNSLKKQ